jgi:hypothetical protein
VPDIIVGAGPGGGPQVRVYDGTTGQPLPGPLDSFYGISPAGFTGGIFVAAGDVNGDGYADIIIGADAGGGPQVQVFSGKDGSLLRSFNAMPAYFSGGVRVAAGDVNGDGLADIIAGAGPGGGPQVTVYSGADQSVLASFFALPASFAGGVTVAAGDLKGAGLADIITGAGPGGLPQVEVFSAAGNGTLLDSFFDPRLNGLSNASGIPSAGVRVAAATVAGTATIVTAPGTGGPSLADVYDGTTLALLDSFFAFDPTYHGGLFVAGCS